MHAFDRQTDGQTDRNLIARPRLHCMQRGKNGKSMCKKIIITIINATKRRENDTQNEMMTDNDRLDEIYQNYLSDRDHWLKSKLLH